MKHTAAFIARIALAPFATLWLSACGTTTGSDFVTFNATAAGPADAPGAGTPFSFTNGRGYAVTLDRAQVYVGAIYLNQGRGTGNITETSCTLPGIYAGQVLDGLTVDLLDPLPKAFPVPGEGTATPVGSAEVWLTAGDINAADSRKVVFDFAGTATAPATGTGQAVYPFAGQVTIGRNRKLSPPSSAVPGANPICKQRIVSPILLADPTLTGDGPSQDGTLTVRIDPRGIFAAVDFAALTPDDVNLEPSATPTYTFVDGFAGAAESALFSGLRANQGTYSFSFSAAPPK